jgi:hypothetical protein
MDSSVEELKSTNKSRSVLSLKPKTDKTVKTSNYIKLFLAAMSGVELVLF